MTIDRAETAGLGASIAAHLLLVALLWATFMAVPPIPPKRQAVEVSIVAETALESGAPEISHEAPAPKLSEVEAPVEPEPPAAEPVVEPKPAPRPEPKPAVSKPAPKPKPAPKTAAKQAPPAKTPAQKKPARSGGRLTGILSGVSDDGGRARAAPAATVSATQKNALAAEIMRQIKPHWSGPNGPDVDALKTSLRVSFARDGSVTSIEFVGTTGVNGSNRSIAPIHKERAIKAVRLASPFRLPANLYEGWKSITVNFDWRL